MEVTAYYACYFITGLFIPIKHHRYRLNHATWPVSRERNCSEILDVGYARVSTPAFILLRHMLVHSAGSFYVSLTILFIDCLRVRIYLIGLATKSILK